MREGKKSVAGHRVRAKEKKVPKGTRPRRGNPGLGKLGRGDVRRLHQVGRKTLPHAAGGGGRSLLAKKEERGRKRTGYQKMTEHRGEIRSGL